jgi:hypothetical protein
MYKDKDERGELSDFSRQRSAWLIEQANLPGPL